MPKGCRLALLYLLTACYTAFGDSVAHSAI